MLAARATEVAHSVPAVTDTCSPAQGVAAVIHGQVTHRRTRPVRHEFTYPAFCLRVPLSRLDTLERNGIARNRRGIVSFHDRDHGPCDGTPLLPWIRGLLAGEGVDADGEIVLHAFPRMLGYVFNPISFWVCFDRAGAVRAVLCEVRNTFGERHLYLLARDDGAPLASGQTLTARKVFHVSPFCAVTGRYAFRFHFSDGRWLARVDYFDGDHAEPLLETWISGDAVPVTSGAARGLPWRYPLFTLAVIARIHWQALKLWTKRVPFFTKPSPPDSPLSRSS
ncbi:MAG: DUF1365 domain-containing protein [Betaproteobacteria bacterium]